MPLLWYGNVYNFGVHGLTEATVLLGKIIVIKTLLRSFSLDLESKFLFAQNVDESN